MTEIPPLEERQALESRMVGDFRAQRTPEAFEGLVRMHLERVRGVLRNLVLSPEDADDLAQESWAIAFEQFEQFRGNSSFSTWVCGIAVKRGLQFLRNQRRREELRTEHEALLPRGQGTRAPDEWLSGQEEESRVTQALASLPDDLRAVIVLITIEQMTPAETAATCGCSVALVYWRLHAARRRLAKLLRPKNDHGK